nr:acyltransferase [Mycobacterium sp. EPa45]
MGTLRTLFAISVVFAHTIGYVFVGGRNAVELFYMISGFLISYVLVEKKVYSNIKSFYINRYLRLYPIYVVVALLTLVGLTVAALALKEDVAFFSVYQRAPLAANALLVFSNLTLFLQDWVLFSGVEHGQLVFSANFKTSDVVLWEGLLVPQAWTLGVELSFYLIAPFVLFRRKLLLVLLSLSILVRIYLIYIGLGAQDPWDYRFFPAELALFLLGALSHQVLMPIYRSRFSRDHIDRLSALSTYFLISITLTFWLIPLPEKLKSVALFAVFLTLMPLTFLFQSRRTWDKRIGELSYPVYICHMLVIHVLNFLMPRFAIESVIAEGLAAVVLSICFSILLNKYIGDPVEGLRDKLRARPR